MTSDFINIKSIVNLKNVSIFKTKLTLLLNILTRLIEILCILT